MKYEEYKDSGMSWIGQVPTPWKRTRLKFLFSHSNAGVWGEEEKGDENDIACFRVADFDYQKGYLGFDKLTMRNITAKELEGRLLTQGSLLIEKSGGGDATPVGRVVRFNYEDKATCSNFVHFVTVDESHNSDFLYYYFYAMYANKENLLYFNQTTGIQNLKVGEYLGQSIFIPTFEEQQAIASYLDEKCGKINGAIDVQKKKIDLLNELKQTIITNAVTKGLNPHAPMKDSGVEWIGQVPAHWEVKRLKYISNIKGRIGFRGYTVADLVPEGEGAFVIGGKHINQCILNTDSPDYISWEKYYESPEIMVALGDIVMAQRGSLGKVALIDKNIQEATINPSLVLLKEIKCNNKYLYYYLVSKSTNTLIELLNTATAVPMISQNQIENMQIPLAPLSEQLDIVKYIDEEVSKIDIQISKANRRIELMNELKQSIITEAVTGKIKVF